MLEILLPALILFCLRILDITLATFRLLMVTRGRKALAWIVSFVKSLIFVITLQIILQGLDDPLKILGYSTGFATGLVVGMWLEGKIAVGYTHLRIISPNRGPKLTGLLRDEGYAVTEIPSWGKEGVVTMLEMNVLRKKSRQVVQFVEDTDPEAFITAGRVISATRGFFRR